ncbi:hypothetical protein B0E38_06462 [Streptomyces sp. 111WW2]|uniref:hypothetical protein n=1 Tax=Streptomyces sp. 111WW2 TaxID=1945515 RepID=UPI000D0C9693|nr:hypothetical protein [Streptomyces sp. 111WW2]PSK47985.1 hypothetical protein B0E38_06462 [Streptomyces sp. 111WW2]
MDSTEARAQKLIDAVNDAMSATSYRDDSPVPAIGATPPVAQPGRPPMSSKATDDSVRMISAGFLTLCAGGAVSGVLYFSGQADPTVIGLMATAPVGLAVPVFALSRLVKRAKPAGDVHHHYNGNVDQRTVNTDARGVWAKNQVKGSR